MKHKFVFATNNAHKLKEVTAFTVPEAVKINEAFFGGNKEIGYLFRHDDDADRKGA